MAKQGLTDLQVKHMKPRDKRYEVAAGPPTGLYLVVQVTGGKSWAIRYRFNGATRKLTLAQPYPEMTLAAARAEAEAKLEELQDGKDPAVLQAQEAEAATPTTAKSVADEWLKRYVKPNTAERTHREWKRILDVDVLPGWKHRSITDIKRPDVLRLLDSIVDRGAPIQANRTLEVIRAWFNWSVERGYIEASPAAGLKLPAKIETRDRVLDPVELGEVWNAADKLEYPNGPFLKLVILTAQRRGEVATMRWSDVDLEKAMLWTLPAEVTKAGRVHDVPLSGEAVAILKALPRFKGDYIFTTTSGEKPINGFSKQKELFDETIASLRKASNVESHFEEWTIHDLRRTAATLMASHGVAPHVLSALLNHSPRSAHGVTHIYNRFRYSEERRAALEAWANYVINLNEEKAKAASA